MWTLCWTYKCYLFCCRPQIYLLAADTKFYLLATVYRFYPLLQITIFFSLLQITKFIICCSLQRLILFYQICIQQDFVIIITIILQLCIKFSTCMLMLTFFSDVPQEITLIVSKITFANVELYKFLWKNNLNKYVF